MKSLLILLFVSFASSDKLNTAYLPPPGAKFAGGGGNGEVPFDVPVRNFVAKDESATRLTPGIYRDGGIISSTYAPISDGSITSTTYTPTSERRLTINTPSSIYKPIFDDRKISLTNPPATYPSTTSNSYSTTPGPYGQQFNNDDEKDPNQYTDKKGGNTKLPFSSANRYEEEGTVSGQPTSFGPTKTENNNREENLFNNANGGNTIRYPERKIRPQEESERNAVILNYENVLTPDGFAYSFDTSNGIHADESGTAFDGVKANGSYSYIGDDGILYNVTYSADEYGFQPRGDHLPTPPPIPDAILKVIEQATKDRDNGIFDDGSYDENKYGFRRYQPGRDRVLGDNNPYVQLPTRKNQDSSAIYQPDDHTSSRSRENYITKGDQKGTSFTNSKKPNDMSPNEDYNDKYYQNQDLRKSDFPSTSQIPGNKQNNLNDPRDRSNYEYNVPSISNTKQNNVNSYDANAVSGPKDSIIITGTKQNFNGPELQNTFIEPQNGYSYPNPNPQFGQQIPNQPSTYDDNNYNNQGFSDINNGFITGIPTKYYTQSTERTDTVQPNNYYSPSTEGVKQYGEYIGRPNDYYEGKIIEQDGTNSLTKFNQPSFIDRVHDSTDFSDRRTENYSPSSTERIKSTGSYTRPNDYYRPTEEILNRASGRPNNYYSPSANNREYITPTDRSKDYYNPASTQDINKFDEVTGRPNVYYNSPSTESNKYREYTDQSNNNNSPTYTERRKPNGPSTRPSNYYSPTSTAYTKQTFTGRPSSTERIKDYATATGKPSIYYGPSSTEKIEDFDTATGQPTNYYDPSYNEKIKDFGTGADRPTEYYSPSSTERIKNFGTATGRPTDYYGTSATERIEDFGTATGRPTNYYSPSSTEIIKDFGTATGRPTNYYSPSSTEIIKNFGTATGRPTDYYSTSATEKIEDFGTATGRPTHYYSPSSTERIKNFDTATGRPTNYSPSSTERTKDFGTATGHPTNYYSPSSTERIKNFDTATGRPTNYYSPTSTERTKDFGTATGRPTNYYSPSSTERIKDFGTATDRPTNYYSPSSTEGTIGEDFSGPKQPQSFDPETGYHY